MVDAFTDQCGEWQQVDSFPEFAVEIVPAFGDMRIQYVDSFPDLPGGDDDDATWDDEDDTEESEDVDDDDLDNDSAGGEPDVEEDSEIDTGCGC